MLILQAKNTGAAKRSDDTQRHSPKLVTYKKVKSQIHTSICKHSLKAIPLNILWIGRINFRLQILILVYRRQYYNCMFLISSKMHRNCWAVRIHRRKSCCR